MNRALLGIHTNTYFTSLLPVARMLKEDGHWTPLLYFVSPYPTVARDLKLCRTEGFDYLCDFPEPPEPAPDKSVRPLERSANSSDQTPTASTAPPNPKSSIPPPIAPAPSLLRTFLRKLFIAAGLDDLLAGIRHFRLLRRRMRQVRHLIRTRDIRLIILAGDLITFDTPAMIRAGHSLRVPSVVVPSWMAGIREAAEYAYNDPSCHLNRWTNLLAAALYPRWALTHRDRGLLRLPAGPTLALQWLGLTPPQPWILHSGYADAIAVESQAMRRYCLTEGLPESQIVVAGSLAHDMMFQQLQNAPSLRAKLYVDLGLPPDKPMLLTALPPNQLYGIGRPECDFQDYAKLVDFWMDSLRAIQTHNIVVSLHPSANLNELRHIESPNLRIAAAPIASLIPLCDFFVASISATIQWAIACSKPVVNYDVYRYRYPDYLGLRGVVLIEEQSAFQALVWRAATNAPYRAELAMHQTISASEWGQVDGQAHARLRQLFDILPKQLAKGLAASKMIMRL